MQVAQRENALHRLFASEWDYAMAQDPLWASSLGDYRFNDRWRDLSPAARTGRARHYADTLKRLSAIDRSKLSSDDQLNYDLFQREISLLAEEAALGADRMPLSHKEGIHIAHDVVDFLRFETVKDYEDWIARMRTFPRYMDQTLALMREGKAAGLLPPRAILSRIPSQLKLQMPANPEDSPFYKPFAKMAAGIPAAEQERLRAQAREAITAQVIPAFHAFDVYFSGEYLPASPEKVGLRNLPNGEKLYAFYARYYTSTELSPSAIHRLGLSEVARIRREMEGVMAQVGFKGTLNAFFAHLKDQKQYFRADADALLMEYRALSRRIDPLLPKLFKNLPRAPYAVEAVPAELAPNSSAAYYMGPAADGSRPGTFYVNLYRSEERPTYEMTPLALHETVPGHHLQIALAQEQSELPAFRRYGGYTAFIEGWGLYSESLGHELGLFEDPYVRFGKLNMEMRRALRLVLDTGLHHEGWDRQKAIKFFLENAAKTELEATNEVDRYLGKPGQALSYKVGELKIQELRARASAKLGSKFDIREFHDVILRQGALPLDVLEKRVDAWIQASKK
ncbi:DUF885 domain-containing protein [bacterium]|nr:DUF885 domain-containing protein [bacterium]